LSLVLTHIAPYQFSSNSHQTSNSSIQCYDNPIRPVGSTCSIGIGQLLGSQLLIKPLYQRTIKTDQTGWFLGLKH